jgi:hypothetical protein
MNITEILEELEIEYKQAGETPHVTVGWLGIICPWCGEGTGKYGLGIALSSRAAKCWKCGSHSLAEALVESSGKPWHVIKALLGGLDTDAPRAEKPTGKLVIPNGVGPLLPIHRDYLRSRNFDPDELAREWGIQGIGMATRLSWRLFLPILHRNKIVSWTTRSLMDEGYRYVNARPEEESIPAKSLLFGSDKALHSIIVTEGIFDAIAIGPGGVATLGVSYSRSQVDKISKYPLRVICYDSEPKAQEMARKLSEEVSIFPGRTLTITLDTGKDPASCKKEEIKRIRKFVFKE